MGHLPLQTDRWNRSRRTRGKRPADCAARLKVLTCGVTNDGWLGSSRQQPVSPQSESLGPGGVALRAPTPATRVCFRLKNHADFASVRPTMLLAAAIVASCLGGDARAGGPQPPAVSRDNVSAEAGEFFEARVRPILAERCLKCHGPEKQSSGLRLDSRAAVLKGGDSGPAVVPGKPAESLLIQAVDHQHGDLKMPPKGQLPEPSVAMLRQWVALGAPWTNESATRTAAAGRTKGDGSPAKTHWAFQPVRHPAPPPVHDRNWVDSPIDAFVLARLEAEGIAPSPRADKRTLIRRATIDLWGIPPTAEEIDAFEADSKPAAFERLVDRLLASPRYGERWGRHWLDVARYADTKGYVFTQDRRYPYAYTYRDYVVAAFNADLGYDQFILQQIAADQLSQGADRRTLAAMGFLTVGRRFLLDQNEIIDDRIDVVSRGLLGLTVTCARCHDHKFDPIQSDDYYALYGVFASSIEPAELPLLAQPDATTPESADFARKLKERQKARDDYLIKRRDEIQKDLATRFSKYLKAAYDLQLEPRSRKLEELRTRRRPQLAPAPRLHRRLETAPGSHAIGWQAGGFARIRVGVASQVTLWPRRAAGPVARDDADVSGSKPARPPGPAQRRHRAIESEPPGRAEPAPWYSTTLLDRMIPTSLSAAIRDGPARRFRGDFSASWQAQTRHRSARGAAVSSWPKPSPARATP